MKLSKNKKIISFCFTNLLGLALIALVGLWLLRGLLSTGFPTTHDGENHLARLANLHLAVIDRNFPFRWAQNLNYKFGYPVFNFNYYLPEAFALIPLKLGFSIEVSLKIVIILSFIAGGFGCYLFLSQYFRRLPALIGALFYLSFPYQLVNVFVRGNVGEILAAGIFPFL